MRQGILADAALIKLDISPPLLDGPARSLSKLYPLSRFSITLSSSLFISFCIMSMKRFIDPQASARKSGDETLEITSPSYTRAKNKEKKNI